MATKPRAVVASSPEVEAAGEELLRRGNAVDAAVAGVWAACALAPAALLGPVQILLGGAGSGLRALDGRVRQPGSSAPRPRGFQNDEEIPDAARVGVPWLPATLAAAMAAAGSATTAQVMAPALALAKGTPRHPVLKHFASHGARAIEERPVAPELLAAAGRPSGGLLTPDDLSSPRPQMLPASRAEIDLPPMSSPRGTRAPERWVVTLPWAHVETTYGLPRVFAPSGLADVASARAVVAVDRHGSFAVAVWDEGVDGIFLEDVGLRAPFFAEPVRRGVTRARPGDARPASAPVALVGTDGSVDVAFAAFGARDAYDVLCDAVASLFRAERIEAHGEARLIAASHANGVASVFR